MQEGEGPQEVVTLIVPAEPGGVAATRTLDVASGAGLATACDTAPT